MSFVDKFLGDQNEKILKKLRPVVLDINNLEPDIEKLSDTELKDKTNEFKKRLDDGASLDDILPEAFACVREVSKRTLDQRHYDVQLMGGIVLHQGKISEMRTGEGKTLASTLPVYLNALDGGGVHVITVNDYLAKRDAVWMGQIYYALGLSTAVIGHDSSYIYDPEYKLEEKEELKEADEERDKLGSFRIEEAYLKPVERKEAYGADVTYGTNNEFGFDYLRDNLVQDIENKVQREHSYAIVDEIDSILIDEARTPLIISAPDEGSNDLYKVFARLVPAFKEDKDYTVDHKMNSVSIGEDGIDKVEKALNIENIYDPASGGGIRYVHNLEQALKAHILFTKDKNYVVKEGEVIIVDEFTGRLMPGRRYSEGLHQAIEAKENVDIKQESRTLASITFQNYFKMYEKLSGMTGTALTSEEEFYSVYALEIVGIPTNDPLIRDDAKDVVFKTEEGKYTALIRDIKERNEKGQPILIGTTSIGKNEYLSALLQKEGIKHEMLNAKNHQREGEIIAQAGRDGAVTVATNMAGRGVDIILGGNPRQKEKMDKVISVGGLHVIGTERHEARRIDDQLRGRAGRQGDPGSSRFYLSLEDELLRVLGGDRVNNLMDKFNIPEDQPIESKIISSSIESAQKRIEGMHFDSRKRLLDYDEVLNIHRDTIYERRNEVLEVDNEGIRSMIKEYLDSFMDKVFQAHMLSGHAEEWSLNELEDEIKSIVPNISGFKGEMDKFKEKTKDNEGLKEEINKYIKNIFEDAYKQREQELGEEQMRRVEKWIILRTIDMLWMDHLDAMNYMRQDVGLRAYAQRDPLVEYKNEGLQLYNILLESIESQVVHTVFRAQVQASSTTAQKVAHRILHRAQEQGAKGKAESSGDGEKIGRNDPCPCGSGKKYKKCGLINAPEHRE